MQIRIYKYETGEWAVIRRGRGPDGMPVAQKAGEGKEALREALREMIEGKDPDPPQVPAQEAS